MTLLHSLALSVNTFDSRRSVVFDGIEIEADGIGCTYRVVREQPRFANVNVNKVDIFYEFVLIPVVCCSFRCTLSLY